MPLALAIVAFTGCQSPAYYSQAVKGQWQIFARREPIQRILSDADTPPDLKRRLEWVLDLREFAEHRLQLPIDGHYLKYADLGRRYVVWNVHAAPEFSLEPKGWRYPFVGRLTYRGYFSEAAARDYAAKLREKGLDVYVEGIEAYSTLGWFKDPVLNTFIHHDEVNLAAILFHELAHQRVFASGDTDFNEAFATAVEEEGTRRWIAERKDGALAQLYEAALRRNAEFVELLTATRERLEAVYALHASETKGVREANRLARIDQKTREAKEAIREELRAEYAHMKKGWDGYTGYDDWFSRSLNNAQLNTVDAYYKWVPAFRNLLQGQGGDLARFYDSVSKLAGMNKDDRHQYMRRLLEAGQGKSSGS